MVSDSMTSMSNDPPCRPMAPPGSPITSNEDPSHGASVSFRWGNHFATGIEQVDQQHHALVDRINQFGELLTQPDRVAAGEVDKLFEELAAYAQYHFGEEEALMDEVGLDSRHVNGHKRGHQDFLQEVILMQVGISDRHERAEELQKFLSYWLAYHILGIDQSMAKQVTAIQAGQPSEAAYLAEKAIKEGVTEPLLVALNGLFHLVSRRNRILRELSRTLEAKVEERTHSLSEANHLLQHLALTDVLTGLPNRTLLLDRLQQSMTTSTRSGSFGALLFIDLDNFKTLNDTHGHDKGDQLLKQVASRLTTCVREGDTVARFGGDEFVVVLAGLSCAEQDAASSAETVAEKILAALNGTYQLGDVAHQSTASIGVTLFKGALATAEDLMKQADLAMYRSKNAGRNAFCFFDPVMEVVVKARAALEEDLRQALDATQFILHYQAQVEGDGRLTGAEVLVRWQHPRRGMVSPAEFIPLAEETGLILPLGRWVLEAACTQLTAWASQPALAHLTVAVNVSAHQFRQNDFVDQVLTVLGNTGANPQRLKLELTESMLVSDMEKIIEKMLALKARGVGFSLDDFGTGYSSLSYLKRLPLDQLKIDQSFVRDVLTDSNDGAIATTIVALGRSLGLDVIAEGVETAAQRDFLASSGCHAYQGYFFARPQAVDGFEAFALRG